MSDRSGRRGVAGRAPDDLILTSTRSSCPSAALEFQRRRSVSGNTRLQDTLDRRPGGPQRTGVGASNTESVIVPSTVLAEIRTAADEENRTPSELIVDAGERYLENRWWQRLLAFGQEQAHKLGLTEADVPRLIAESRQERSGAER